MFIFPYNTDAPIYYWPVITVCIIVLNVVIFILEIAYPEQVLDYMLAVGDGIHPVQWLTHNFLHADLGHLFFNMLFLWVFGLVVEGKLGPWKTLITYCAIGIFHGAVVQLVTLGHEPTYCLGASAVIFAFMVMSLIWAPENSINCVLVVMMFPFFRIFYIEVLVKIMVGLYVAIDLFSLIMKQGALSTEFLHTVGAVIGLAVGIAFLKWKVVDCESWDIFSVWKGHHTISRTDRAKLKKETVKEKEEREQKQLARQNRKQAEILQAITEDHSLHASTLYRKVQHEFPAWTLPENDLLRLIRSLIQKQLWSQAILMMKEYLKHYTNKAQAIRLYLAEAILLGENQPGPAMKILRQIDITTLSPKEQLYHQKLSARIKQLYEQRDTYEMDVDLENNTL